MRKNSRKLQLNRETLRGLSDMNQRGAVGGLATKLCTGTEECTQSLCGGFQFTRLCTTDQTVSCPQVFTCVC